MADCLDGRVGVNIICTVAHTDEYVFKDRTEISPSKM
jgi:hypothetical protein